MQSASFIPAPLNSTPMAPTKVTIGPRQACSQNIKLHKQGETVKAIEVQCSCGEITMIECHYQ